MASQFYARYVPPVAILPQAEEHTQRNRNENQKKGSKPKSLKEADHGETSMDTRLAKEKIVKDKVRKREKRKRDPQIEEPEDDTVDEGLAAKKHTKVRSMYEKSGELSKLLKEKASIGDLTAGKDEKSVVKHPTELHGLEPIPQPQPEDNAPHVPISALPEWIANPVRCSATQTIPFDELPLHPTMTKALRSKGYRKSFAIQSAVLPMLLPGPQSYDGDICIASGTGTGKTLAFVLPMIEALKNQAERRLRGLVVVPTRELVSQTRLMFEICGAGSGLQVATSEGSKTLLEERKALIKKSLRYDPQKSQQQREAPVQFMNLGDSMDEESDLDELPELLKDYVAHYSSKVDVLICTPGRLVDHLKGTKGFSLDCVEWFVIDEVDRLLNQSYQEWIENVVPALETENVKTAETSLLKSLGRYKRRRVRKVIASATLTTDVGKLVALNLHQPALVSLEGSESQLVSHDLSLPSGLQEVTVQIKDASEKPLFLLRLLDEVAREKQEEPQVSANMSLNDTIAEDDTSSDDSDKSSSDTDGISSNSGESDSDGSSSESQPSARDETSSDSSTEDEDAMSIDLKEPSYLLDSARPRKSLSRDNFDSAIEGQTTKSQTVGTLIFTTTNENALRLARLLKILRPSWSSRIDTLVGTNSSTSRRKTLAAFRKQQLSILITSNLASRGLNVSNLAQVINYDPPTSLESYVHRVGRTARAGGSGHAVTLLAHHEARWFWKEIARSSRVHREHKVTRAPLTEISSEEKQMYAKALAQLGREARGGNQSS